MVVPADWPHRAGLRPVVSLLFRERHFGPDLQAFGRVAQNTPAMKVDLASVRRFKEPASFIGE
jgi:hypothetical protein